MEERIYYMLDPVAGEIKIGISVDVDHRQQVLANERGTALLLLASHRGTVNDERRSHAACGHYRRSGEWFEDCEAVRNHIHGRVRQKASEALRQVQMLIETLNDHARTETLEWKADMTAAIREEMAEYLRLLDFCPDGQVLEAA